MDPEELERTRKDMIDWFGPAGERLFQIAVSQERIYLFQKFRELIIEKDQENDEIAVEVLSWAWQRLADY